MSLHVVPVDDLIAHEKHADCVCDPDYRDGIWVHHSLDGRELREAQR